MSRRISNQLNITDSALAVEALKLASCDFDQRGDSLYITSGMLRNAVINLKTGEMIGDSDHGHTEEKFGVLRQWYAEAQVRAECAKNGTTVDEKLTDAEGNTILLAHMA